MFFAITSPFTEQIRTPHRPDILLKRTPAYADTASIKPAYLLPFLYLFVLFVKQLLFLSVIL